MSHSNMEIFRYSCSSVGYLSAGENAGGASWPCPSRYPKQRVLAQSNFSTTSTCGLIALMLNKLRIILDGKVQKCKKPCGKIYAKP